MRRFLRDERGSAIAVEALFAVPALLLCVALAVVGGRIWYANTLAESAAAVAARAATLSPTAEGAQAVAAEAAGENLALSGINCANLTATVDTSQMVQPLGQVGTVTANVTCTLDLSYATGLGFGQTFTVTAQQTSPTDPYSES